jgi:DNA-binding response OmpR family regulator
MPATSVARGKVLVVDDDPVVLEIVKELLLGSGYTVDIREQALGTAQWVASEKPDFVLLDVKMPALSGGELTQLIRRKEATNQVAVILHSSIDSEALNALARSTGALGAIKKTSNSKLFIAEFERLVARHRANKTKT